MSFLYRIYIISAAVGIICLILFFYGFGIMDSYNESVATRVAAKNKEYQELVQEQHSYEQNQKDLKDLAAKPLQPDNFFSQDVRLVKEIKTLEGAADQFDVTLELKVAGTVNQGLPVKGTTSGIVSIPYTMSVTGTFSNVVMFLDKIEHLSFVTHVGALTVNAADKGAVKATIAATFFLQK